MHQTASPDDESQETYQERREREQETRERASRRSNQAFGLLSAVRHSLSGMMDVDPEATRRANIGKTRDNISQVRSISLQVEACAG